MSYQYYTFSFSHYKPKGGSSIRPQLDTFFYLGYSNQNCRMANSLGVYHIVYNREEAVWYLEYINLAMYKEGFGKSAYEIAVDNGFSGTEQQWLTSLIGASGTSGVDGKSAYQIAVDNGFVGTQQEWLASLVGQTGATGAQGPAGADWVPTSQELNDIAQRVINLLPDANEVNY